ncbi:hypothetical protein [Sporosarcina sp. JAI121]|uniref:DUF6904 family protein n=1 Tax=Sporosarcina sp. JAI121 TaxID=2723064 RepID=UPI0015CDE9FA|nr:hypothetical protein [Sporosarcina sp. JAI121]NYF23611.1 hypothetical protein [Sporosarcina sp. JAI121]
MIQMKSTKNHAGVTISGDIYDFEELYDALHTVVGEEGERIDYDGVRIRVLAICYDLRHAMMGNRQAVNVPNGLDRDRMRYIGLVGSDHNVYYQFEVLWPELLFVSLSLTDFLVLYERGKTVHTWDPEAAAVRKFQAGVAKCLQETLTEKKFATIKKYFNSRLYDDYANYTTQYIDKLNIGFIKMDKDKRLNNISIMAKRIAERDHRYIQAQAEVSEAAAYHGVSQYEIRFDEEYPTDIEW